jgi:hypothetical protein
MHSNTLLTFITTLAMCGNICGMDTLSFSEWLPKKVAMAKTYGDLHRHYYLEPTIDDIGPVVLAYENYELAIPRSLAEQFAPIKAKLNERWNHHDDELPRYMFNTDSMSSSYTPAHVSQLLRVTAHPKNPHPVINLNDVIPLLTLADELGAPENTHDVLNECILTILNKTLATEDTASDAEQKARAIRAKQKAVEIYRSIIEGQDPETIIQIAKRAKTDGAMVGIYNLMYSSDLWRRAFWNFKKYLSTNPHTPEFNAWLTQDPARVLFGHFVQHKRSIKTKLEKNNIDSTQSHQLEYWKKKYPKKAKSEHKIITLIESLVKSGELDSIHDAHLLPGHMATSSTLSHAKRIEFTHFPLMAYLRSGMGSSYFFYEFAPKVVITSADWDTMYSNRENIVRMEVSSACPITVPKQYEADYKIKKTDGGYFTYIKPKKINPSNTLQPAWNLLSIKEADTNTKNILINTCALGLAASSVYAAYKFNQYLSCLQTTYAHNFLQIDVTDATRSTYQLLYTLSPLKCSSSGKQLLDNALAPLISGPITIDLVTAIECENTLSTLDHMNSFLKNAQWMTCYVGYIFIPILCDLSTRALIGLPNGIVQNTIASIKYVYAKLGETKQAE